MIQNEHCGDDPFKFYKKITMTVMKHIIKKLRPTGGSSPLIVSVPTTVVEMMTLSIIDGIGNRTDINIIWNYQYLTQGHDECLIDIWLVIVSKLYYINYILYKK